MMDGAKMPASLREAIEREAQLVQPGHAVVADSAGVPLRLKASQWPFSN